jgi:KUP system potassium uptake protein
MHERIVLATVMVTDEPYVGDDRRISVESIAGNLYKVRVTYGFMDKPDLPEALTHCASQGLELEMMDTSFFLGRETLIPKVGSDMALWREKLFIAMFRNAGSAAAYFKLPPNRVVELGAQVVL